MPDRKAERRARNERYLDNLTAILQELYNQGLISADTADTTLESWRQQFESGRKDIADTFNAPFYGDIVSNKIGNEISSFEIESYLNKLKRTTQTYQATKAGRESAARTYLPQLNDFLNWSVRQGQITSEQAKQQLQWEQTQIQQGIAVKDLPNYQGIQSYQDWHPRATPEQIKDWSKNNFIATPDMDVKEREALNEYKVNTFMETQALEEHQKSQEQWQSDMRSQASGQRILGSADQLEYQAWQARQIPLANAWEENRRRELRNLPKDYGWLRAWELLKGKDSVNPYVWNRQQQEERDIASSELGNLPVDERNRILAERASPPTPAFLANMFPELKVGQPLQKVNVPPPSGQQWTGLSPREQQMWAGFADWSGGSYEDLLGQMEIRQPVTPPAGRGWRPAQQRT